MMVKHGPSNKKTKISGNNFQSHKFPFQEQEYVHFHKLPTWLLFIIIIHEDTNISANIKFVCLTIIENKYYYLLVCL